MARMSLPKPAYSNPAHGRGVVGALRGAQVMGRATDQAQNRRVKLNDALGKLRGK